MNKIYNAQTHGESNFSSMDGSDDYYGEDDSYYGEEENYDGMDYDNMDYDNATGPRGGSKRPGVINTPQRTISWTTTNNTGTVAPPAFSAATSVLVSYFQSNLNGVNSGSTNNALGILKNNNLLNALIDTNRYVGNVAITGNDIVVVGSPAPYLQLFQESQNSPYRVVGLKIQSNNIIQLTTAFNTVDVNLLGATQTVPYTPDDKFSAYQFQNNIIEDREFQLSYSGNAGFEYNVLNSVAAGGLVGTPNFVKFSMYLYKISELSRVNKGKNPTVTAPNKKLPWGGQTIRMVK